MWLAAITLTTYIMPPRLVFYFIIFFFANTHVDTFLWMQGKRLSKYFSFKNVVFRVQRWMLICGEWATVCQVTEKKRTFAAISLQYVLPAVNSDDRDSQRMPFSVCMDVKEKKKEECMYKV